MVPAKNFSMTTKEKWKNALRGNYAYEQNVTENL